MSETIQWREPADFTVGDTLLFQRNLPDYLPSDGWAVRLTVTENTATGATKVAEAVSTPDTTSQYHVFNVPNFCAGLAAGTYVLSEEVFNAAGEKHQIYVRPDFQLQDDLADGLATAPVLTEAQTNLALLNDTYRSLIKLKFAETEDLRSRFRIQDEAKILADIKYWKSVRILEIQQERARNGQNPGNVQEAIFAIG
ncbi:MAG: hypothetical protein KGJ13_05850 [Patescibacteria group bacterium]|nr:hypothetical protein [Patescibacteria group bacterium]